MNIWCGELTQGLSWGSDVAIVTGDYASQGAVFEAMVDAVKSGRVGEQRLNESVERILKLKGD